MSAPIADSFDHDALGIDAACAALLDPSTSLGGLKLACDGFHARCLAQLGALDTAGTQLDSGKALAPADAARCVQDFLRTACFVQGVDAAIGAVGARAARPIEVLYVGCGPLAPLALLLARRYRGVGVRFTLVDIHPGSLTAARHLFTLAGATTLVRETVCIDASRMSLRGHPPYDVLVVEVMQRALSREPQLAVLANLLPQCGAGVMLVPARVVVSACLARIASEHGSDASRERIALGTLIDVSRQSMPVLAAALAANPDGLREVQLDVPVDAPSGLDLMLCTRIETSSGRVLGDYDSGLTYPLLLPQIGVSAPGERLGFRYRMGRDPGFEVRRVQPDRTA